MSGQDSHRAGAAADRATADLGSVDLGTVDLATVGETMAAFVPEREPGCYRVAPIGAESNVAIGMAQLGCRTRWVSRLGADQLGRQVADFVSAHGVDVQVDWDDTEVTGACVKELTPTGTRVRYYRSHSAARHLGHEHADRLGPARWVHLTGVTPALSASCAALVDRLVVQRRGPAGQVSFDVNYRPALWESPAAAARVLVPLARAADVVFIGDDEAEVLLGSSDEEAVRRSLLVREGQHVVLKRGAGEASLLTLTDVVAEPALPVTVVDVTGAGDAFAAGYLAGACWGWPARQRLRMGHELAGRVVGVTADTAPGLAQSETERLPPLPGTARVMSPKMGWRQP